MAISKNKTISRGSGENKDEIQTAWFLQHKESMVIRLMPNVEPDRMRSMWKEAHGFTVPNHTKEDSKPQRKRSKKKED